MKGEQAPTCVKVLDRLYWDAASDCKAART